MLLTLEIFWRARNHDKKFLQLCQTSFRGRLFSFNISGKLKHIVTKTEENILKLSFYVKTGCSRIYDTKSSSNFLCDKMH